ncbi:hypothetical protein [Pseudomonas sp. 1152_12]|uniref:hypothetical protein n=1 Tax=Pseudomonas sp. 1152_12 TaxID=2604455 RepID=UPI00406451D0
MAIIPLALALSGVVIWKKIDADNSDQKIEADKAWKRFEPHLNHTFDTYKRHEAKGELAQAIRALKQHISLFNERGSVTSGDKKYLDRILDSLIFKSQENAKLLSREFKAKAQSLQDDPTELSGVHYEYIQKLKILLPGDDAFLLKEVKNYDQLYPRISL